MLKNYFKTAFQILLRYKGFALINIASLTIGMIGCMAIGLFVWDEWQYDKNIPEGQLVYRIYDEQKDNNNIKYMAPVPPVFTSFLQRQYPEVDVTARIFAVPDKYLWKVNDKKNYEGKGWMADSTFFKVFPIAFSKGDPITALNSPSAIIISEGLARKYFGNQDAMGKTILINNNSLKVSGVFAELPEHFHLDFQYLMAMPYKDIPTDSWTWNQFYTYIKFKPGTNVHRVQDKFQAYVRKEIYPTLKQAGFTFLPLFQQLEDIHLHSSDFVFDNAIRGNITYVRALTVIAIFVLVIACFNFINLATARSLRRAKEIGVRKVVGAGRMQLIFQFIGETILLAFLSMTIAVVTTIFIVPFLNDFTGKSIEFSPLRHPLLAAILLAAGIVIGILAGIYPALVLSGFRPVKVLKSMRPVGHAGSGILLRHALVVLQFTLSVLLIVSTIIVYRQTKYLNNKDLGFNKEQVVYFSLRDSLSSNPNTLEVFKNELKRSPSVVSVTSGYGLPGDRFAGDAIMVGAENKELLANVFIGDKNYITTLGLRILAGRDFSENISTDVNEAFIVNETAVKEFGFGTPEKAIGQPMSWKEWVPADDAHSIKKGKVIGVVADFNYSSLHEKVAASVIQLYPKVALSVAVKLKSHDLKNTLAYINSIWDKFSPVYPLDYKFMDESYGEMYKTEEKLSDLLWIFTVMAIIVGCMGLFGLATFSAEQRMKEIGIRKILGAGIFDIMGLLSKNFLLLVLIASLIAFPIAWWAMNNWLKDFPYRIAISGWIFGIAILCALLIALLTVSFQAIKAAVVNPVESLRTE
jgi:putative ABC transport system permease protein